MKSLFLLAILAFIAPKAEAFVSVKSLTLKDLTIINGEEVSAINMNLNDNSLYSIELIDGEEIDKSEIKSIQFNSDYEVRASSRTSGEGSGG